MESAFGFPIYWLFNRNPIQKPYTRGCRPTKNVGEGAPPTQMGGSGGGVGAPHQKKFNLSYLVSNSLGNHYQTLEDDPHTIIDEKCFSLICWGFSLGGYMIPWARFLDHMKVLWHLSANSLHSSVNELHQTVETVIDGINQVLIVVSANF